MKGIIVMYTKDASYGCAFMDYLKDQGIRDWEGRIFSDALLLHEYVTMNHPTVIVSDLLDEVYEEVKGCCLYLIGLSEDYQVDREQSRYVNTIWIYKYQKVDFILEELFRMCRQEENGCTSVLTERNMNVTVLYSHLGSRVIRRVLRQKAEEQSQHLLYLSMEQMPDCEREELTMPGMSEFLYQMKERSCLGTSAIRRYLVQEGSSLDCMRPIRDYRDVLDVTADDWKYVLDWLRNSEYTRVVIGCDSLGEHAEELWRMANECWLLLDEARESWTDTLVNYLTMSDTYTQQIHLSIGSYRGGACEWRNHSESRS